MPDISQIVLPVKDPITSEVTNVTYNIKCSGGGGSTAVVPVDPATIPSEEGALWITTT